VGALALRQLLNASLRSLGHQRAGSARVAARERSEVPAHDELGIAGGRSRPRSRVVLLPSARSQGGRRDEDDPDRPQRASHADQLIGAALYDRRLMAAEPVTDVTVGDGYAVASIDAIGEDYGFRKIRRELGVTAFGMNAIAIPPGYESGRHFHDEQEDTYFVHRGTIEFEFGDGSKHVLGPGGLARVDAATVRKIRNVADEDALYVIVGGKDGYVGRDGRLPEGEETARPDLPPGAAA
jgi:quercetin dioxygenase-like cupin family protein